ncbi:MAG: tetratricopeptide repeat protein, partial [Candidatus Margulisiibacteriota bacterium]
EAITYFERAREVEPNNARLHADLASCYYEQGDLPEAINCLKRSLELEPRDQINVNCIINYYLELDNALAELDAFFRNGNMLKSVDFRNLNRLIACFINSQDNDRAIPYLEEGLRRKPQDLYFLGKLAQCFRQQKRYAEAVDCLQICVQLEPCNVKTLCNLVSCLIRLGRYEEARPYLDQVDLLDPEDPFVLRLKSNMQRFAGQGPGLPKDYYEARQWFFDGRYREVIALIDGRSAEDNSSCHFQGLKAECLRKMGDFEPAISLFESTLASLRSDHSKNRLKIDLLNGLAYCYLELLKKSANETEKREYKRLAFQAFNEAIKLSEGGIEMPRTYSGLGFYYLELSRDKTCGQREKNRNLQKAGDCFRKALEINPGNANALSGLELLKKVDSEVSLTFKSGG